MRNLPALIAVSAGCLLASCSSRPEATASAQGRDRDVPGQRADGSVRLPNQWFLRPVGRQIELGDFPVNIAVHPSGRWAAVLHAGYGQHEIVVVDLRTEEVASRTKLKEAFYGIEFSADGKKVFSSGAGEEAIFRFAFADGAMTEEPPIPLRPVKERGIPSGMAVDAAAKHLFVANVWGHQISEVDLTTGTVSGEAQLGGTNRSVTVLPPQDSDLAATTKRAEANAQATDLADPFPYSCRLDERRQRLYVSLWARAEVAVVDLRQNTVVAHWPTEEHPNEMALTRNGRRLFVANANRNTVTLINTDTGRTEETIFASFSPDLPPGSTPNSVALSPDEKTLYVANACNNMVAVIDVATPGHSRSLGFIPVGWYPTSVRVTPDGKHLLVTNGKGVISKANPEGPQPGVSKAPGSLNEYIGGLFRGTLSVIDLPRPSRLKRQMADWTAEAFRCRPQTNIALLASLPTNHPIPSRPGDASPIQHVVYIIKENRTYDQILGDMKEGNGDPKLCLFPESVTPNHHALAREFVLLDNFYVESEVSADGHEWTMGAYATDFVEKFWPMSYGHNKRGKYLYPAEGNFPIATPAGGYLWDRAKEAGVSYRSYGEWVADGKTPNDPGRAKTKALEGHIDPWFRSFDMDYTDQKRAERFISELKRFEQKGDMPRLQIVRLPSDHTSGASVGKLTPTAHVGDNDLGLGMVIEALSRSKFWAHTAVFVVEDDAQNGPDHVDAHRTIAYVISPYVKRGSVDSTLYSTSSMLRTMELILGLKPMSQFDAAALPMYRCFQPAPDTTAYTLMPVTVDLNAKNGATAWGADKARSMDFSKEDAADDLVLNEMIWRSVRGADQAMPAPTRAAFVFAKAAGDDDDD
jgi:YVTN family beta-propeller protein